MIYQHSPSLHLSPLSPKQQLELLTLAKQGDREARDRLILTNQALVRNMASHYWRKFHTGTLDKDDFMQAGMEALCESVEKFKLSYNNNFSTYATYHIRHRMNKLIEQQSLPLKLDLRIYRKLDRRSMNQLRHPVSTSTLTEGQVFLQADLPDAPDFYNLQLLRTCLAVKGLLTTRQCALLMVWASGGATGSGGSAKPALTRLRWYMTNLPIIRE